MAQILPRYPVYVPSKGRAETCFTARFLIEDKVPFHLVVEPQDFAAYAARFGAERLIRLPGSTGNLAVTRNWIKDHSIAAGAARHWQLDDNIRLMRRMWKQKRIPIAAGIALAATEDFVDRYENVAVAGMNYDMFSYGNTKGGIPPFYLNAHVYSCSLILNSIPHRWRHRYNDDTDLCLQVLADGWCTVLMNAFIIDKMRTMTVPGGNTPIYQADGRLKMARALERLWPRVVATKRRFQRPQHVIFDTWRRFDTPLKPKPEFAALVAASKHAMTLTQYKPRVRSAALRALLREHGAP